MCKRSILLIIVVCFGNASAETKDDLWFADVALIDKSLVQRNTSIRVALHQVLSKVMPPNIKWQEPHPLLKKLLHDAPLYVNQYSYSNVKNIALNHYPSYRMQVSFDQKALAEKLRSIALPVWLGNRPKILIWLSLEYQGTKRWFDASAQAVQVADKFGLTLIQPLLDFEDRKIITSMDTFVGGEEVQKIYDRYGTKTILLGKLHYQQNCWHSQWNLHFNKQIGRWKQNCVSIDTALEFALQETYHNLFQQYAINWVEASTDELVLKISGIKNFYAMIQVKRFLASILMIRSVNLKQIAQGQHYYQVKFFGDRNILMEILTAEKILQNVDKKAGPNVFWLALQTDGFVKIKIKKQLH